MKLLFSQLRRGRAGREWIDGEKVETGAGRSDPGTLHSQNDRTSITLYEQNIGPLTPILAETLQEAEDTYPAEWIEEAIRMAVTKNVRNWRYVEAILRSWKEKGRNETDRRSNQEDRKRDSEGNYADYINH